MIRLALLLLLSIAVPPPGWAADNETCPIARHALWGDGVHDDTAALNAWFRGEAVVWAGTRQGVGDEIADRSFLLSNEIIVPAGSGRSLLRFRLEWPRRPETVSGDALRTGADPERAPVAVNVRIIGGGPDEGVAFEAPDPPPDTTERARNCLVS